MRIVASLRITALPSAAFPVVPTGATGHESLCDTSRLDPSGALVHGPLQVLYECIVPGDGAVCGTATDSAQWALCVATNPTSIRTCGSR